MPVLCPDYNFLFLCVAKTGSTSVAQHLIDNHGGRWLPDDHVWNEDGTEIVVDYKHATPRQLVRQKIVDERNLLSWRLVAVTRNPFDWVVSLYEYRRKMYETHKQGIAAVQEQLEGDKSYSLAKQTEHHGVPNWVLSRNRLAVLAHEQNFEENTLELYGDGSPRSVCGKYVEDYPVTVLRYESLDESISSLTQSLGIESVMSLPRVNVNEQRSRDWRSYYSPASRRIVEKAFLGDLGKFNYSFND